MLAGCSEPDPSRSLADARAFFAEGDYATAATLIRNVIERDTGDFEARALLGEIALITGDLALAELHLEAARSAGLQPGQYAVALANTYLQSNRTPEATAVLSELAEPDRKVDYWLTRARIAIADGDIAAADASLTTAVALDGQTAEWMYEKARLELARDNAAGAMAELDRAIELDPGYGAALALRGTLAQGEGRTEDAITDFVAAADALEARSQARLLADVLLRLVQARLAANEIDGAAESADRLSRILPDAVFVDYANALVEFQRGRYESVIQILRIALSKAPGQPQLASLLGAAHLAVGNVGQAEQQFLTVLSDNPTDVAALRLLAEARVRQQRPRAALDALARLDEQQLERDAGVLVLEGIAYIQAGEPENAIPFLQQARSLAPSDQSIVLQLARAFSEAGQVEEAYSTLGGSPSLTIDEAYAANIVLLLNLLEKNGWSAAEAHVERLAQDNPEDAQARMLGALLALLQNDDAVAGSRLAATLAIDPDFVPALLASGNLLAKAGRISDAERRFQRALELDERNLAALMSLAEVAARRDDAASVVAYLERATQATTAAGPHLLLARYYASRQDGPAARAQVEAATLLDPNPTELLVTRAMVETAEGDRVTAIATLEQAWAQNQSWPSVALLLAELQADALGLDAAIETLTEAVGVMPAVMELRAALGVLRLRAGDQDAALAIARELQVEYSARAAGFALEGELRMAARSYDAAADAFEKAFQRDPSWPRLTGLLAALRMSSRPAAAEPLLRDWLAENPADVRARLYLGDLLRDSGDLPSALDAYVRVTEIDPVNLTAFNNAAWYAHVLGRPGALDFARMAVSLGPDDAAALDTLGWILTEQGQPAEGLEFLQSATQSAPQALEIRYHLAVAQARAGRIDAARRTLESLLAEAGTFTQRADARALLESL